MIRMYFSMSLAMFEHRPEKEAFVPVLQGGEEDIAFKVGFFPSQVAHDPLDLPVLVVDGIRQQSAKAVCVPFFPRKGGGFIGRAVAQEIHASFLASHVKFSW